MAHIAPHVDDMAGRPRYKSAKFNGAAGWKDIQSVMIYAQANKNI
jgi:hypothetical protein